MSAYDPVGAVSGGEERTRFTMPGWPRHGEREGRVRLTSPRVHQLPNGVWVVDYPTGSRTTHPSEALANVAADSYTPPRTPVPQRPRRTGRLRKPTVRLSPYGYWVSTRVDGSTHPHAGWEEAIASALVGVPILQGMQTTRQGRRPSASQMRRVRDRLVRRDGDCCHYCEATLPAWFQTTDHVVPRTLGGPDEMANYVIACEPCNNRKGDGRGECGCDFCSRAWQLYRGTDPLLA